MLVLLALSQFIACGSPAQAAEGQAAGLEVAVYEYDCPEDISGEGLLMDLPSADAIYQVEICSSELETCLPAWEAGARPRRQGTELRIACGGGFGVHADLVRLKVIQ